VDGISDDGKDGFSVICDGTIVGCVISDVCTVGVDGLVIWNVGSGGRDGEYVGSAIWMVSFDDIDDGGTLVT
jgi:hypothetical protein